MNISANELKIKGLGAISNGLKHHSEAVITSRGKPKCVVMTIEKYNEFSDIKEELIKWQLQSSSLRDRKLLAQEIDDFDGVIADGLKDV